MFEKNAPRSTKARAARKENYQFRRHRVAVAESHHLDLNPETDVTRREARRRTARRGFRMAMGLFALIAVTALGRLVVKEAFLESARFRLKEISVNTEGALTRDEIIAAAGVQTGMNTLMISLSEVRDRIQELPQVRKAKVTRNYPDKLIIDVDQRHAVAWLVCPQQSLPSKARGFGCLLDQEGHVLPSFGDYKTPGDLPTITVDKLKRLVPGEKVENCPKVYAALELLLAHQVSRVKESMKLLNVDATSAYALVANYDTKLAVTFSRHELARQLHRLECVVEDCKQRQRLLATVNLLVDQNVPVTFRNEGVSATPLPEKRLSTKRSLANAN